MSVEIKHPCILLQVNPYTGLQHPRITSRCAHIQAAISSLPLKVSTLVAIETRLYVSLHMCSKIMSNLCTGTWLRFARFCSPLYTSNPHSPTHTHTHTHIHRSCTSFFRTFFPTSLALIDQEDGDCGPSVALSTLTSPPCCSFWLQGETFSSS